MPDSFDFSQNPARSQNLAGQFPLITYMLCAACVLVTASFLTAGEPQSGTAWYKLGHFGLGNAWQVWDGRYYELFTTTLIHGSIMHILFNMLWFVRLGRTLEETLHPALYALILLAAAAFGSCTELLYSGQTGIGFSGVVYALFGLMWAGRGAFPAWRALATRENLNVFLIWGVFCVFTTAAGIMTIANGAHAGGLVFGLAIGYLFFAPRRRTYWAIPLALLVVISGIALFWMPWSSSWNWWKGVHEAKQQRFESAIRYYERSIVRGGEPSDLYFNISLAWQQIALREAKGGDAAKAEQAARNAVEAERKSGQTKAAPASAGDEENPSDGGQNFTGHQIKPPTHANGNTGNEGQK